MATNSFKLICPECYRSVRATKDDIYVICGYCRERMRPVPSYNCSNPAYNPKYLPKDGGAADG